MAAGASAPGKWKCSLKWLLVGLTSRLSWQALCLYWVRGQAALVARETSAPLIIPLAMLVLLLGAGMACASDDALTNGLELIPEQESLWNESLLWSKDVVVRAGLGYKDNVLLSPSGGLGSMFFNSGLDLTLYRLPLDGLELNISATADDVRYWHSPGGLNGEDLVLGIAQVQRYFGGVWRSGLEFRGLYADQVIQELLEIGGVSAIEAKGSTASIRPFLRRDFGTNWWVQLEAPISREWWDFPLDNYWKSGGQMTLGLAYGHHSQITLSYGNFYINHDQWLARDAAGDSVDGMLLDIWRQTAELKWDHAWDAAHHWSSSTKFAFQRDEANGGGFFSYNRYQLSEELRFRNRNWEFKGSAAVSYYDFPIQTIDVPPSPLLHITTLDLGARAERRIFKELRLFASFSHEQAISNDSYSEYKANITSGGLSWEF